MSQKLKPRDARWTEIYTQLQEDNVEFFLNTQLEPTVRIPTDGFQTEWPVDSLRFQDLLVSMFYEISNGGILKTSDRDFLMAQIREECRKGGRQLTEPEVAETEEDRPRECEVRPTKNDSRSTEEAGSRDRPRLGRTGGDALMSSSTSKRYPEFTIGEFCDTGSGGTPARSKGSEYFGGSIPWVKSGELREGVITSTEETITEAGLNESAAKLLPPHTLLVALYGATVGRIGILGVEAATNQAICHIIPDESRADRRYLFYALQAQVPFWLSKRVGVGQPNISQGVVRDTRIPLPPMLDQKRIAAILDRADIIRTKQKEVQADFNQLIDSQFLETFGDPLRNPKGWKNGSFDDQLTLVQYGPRFFNEAYSSDGVRIVRITDLDFQGQLDFAAMPLMDVSDKDKTSYCLRTGDLLLARSGATVGKTALIDGESPECIAGAYFIRLRFKNEIRPLFAQMVLRSKPVQRIIAERSRQSAQQNFNGPAIRALPLPVPPIELQDRFVLFHQQAIEIGKRIASASDEMNDLFNALVQRSFRGEL